MLGPVVTGVFLAVSPVARSPSQPQEHWAAKATGFSKSQGEIPDQGFMARYANLPQRRRHGAGRLALRTEVRLSGSPGRRTRASRGRGRLPRTSSVVLGHRLADRIISTALVSR